MTRLNNLHKLMNETIADNSISEEVDILQETTNGNSSLYTVKNKNGVTFWQVPGPSGFTDRGFVGFIQRDPGRPVLLSGSSKISNTKSNAAAVSWPVADITPTLIPVSLLADSQLSENSQTTNFGSGSSFSVRVNGALKKLRGILQFQTGTASFSLATLKLYLWQGNPTGDHIVDVVRVTQPNWTELEVTWNEYSSGNSWVTPGGDLTETNKASTTILSSQDDEHITWDITNLVTWARANNSGILNIAVKLQTESVDTTIDHVFLTKETFLDDTTKPQLILT
jgi:hypothetical protein